MHVLIAFDKFKDSLTAPHACALTAAALRERHPDWTLDLCPLADGGDGFCEILTRAAGGIVETHTVTGPRGTPTPASIGFVPLANIPSPARTLLSLDMGHGSWDIPPTVAVVEMATASGLALLPPDQRDLWHTTTVGTGELIRLAAADLVITGEGSFDDTSLTGKGPGAVAARALALGKLVHVFAGAVSTLKPRDHLTLHAITPAGTPLAQALRAAPELLTAAVHQSL